MTQPAAPDPQLPTVDSPRGEMKVNYTLDAPRDVVFDAWVTPAKFAGWFGAELEVPVDSVELDARPGGLWRATMVQGATRVPFAGTFLEVKAPQRIVMTFDDPDRIGALPNDEIQVLTVTFRNLGARTEVQFLQQGPMAPGMVAGLTQGYTSFMVRLGELLAGHHGGLAD